MFWNVFQYSDIELKNADTNIPADDHIKNGIDICTQLRKNGYQGDIIFLTAFREYVFDGYQAQAINYLLKPVSPEAIDRLGLFICKIDRGAG